MTVLRRPAYDYDAIQRELEEALRGTHAYDYDAIERELRSLVPEQPPSVFGSPDIMGEAQPRVSYASDSTMRPEAPQEPGFISRYAESMRQEGKPPSYPVSGEKRTRTKLSEPEETAFEQWYQSYATTNELDPNPDNPLHKYDYRGAWKAMQADPEKYGPAMGEDGYSHLPSLFKDFDHPNRFVDGADTKKEDGEPGFATRYGDAMRQEGVPESSPRLDKPGGLWRGFVSGMAEQNPQAFGQASEAIGLVTNSDLLGRVGKKLQSFEVGADYKTKNLRYDEVQTLSDALTFLEESLGQGVASSVPSMAGRTAAAAALSPLGPGGVAAGALTGSFIPAYLLNLGDLYQSLKEEGVEPDRAARIAMPGAVALGALEVAGLENITRAFTGAARKKAIQSMAKRIAVAGLKGGGGETATEGAQQAIQESILEVAGTQDVSTGERVNRVIDAAFKGGITGFFMSAPGGVSRQRQAVSPETAPEPADLPVPGMEGQPVAPAPEAMPEGEQAPAEPEARPEPSPAATESPVALMSGAQRVELQGKVTAAGHKFTTWLRDNYPDTSLTRMTVADYENALALLETARVEKPVTPAVPEPATTGPQAAAQPAEPGSEAIALPAYTVTGKRLELKFPDDTRGPTEIAKEIASQGGWRFDEKNKRVWYATASPAHVELAKRLTQGETAEVPAPGPVQAEPVAEKQPWEMARDEYETWRVEQEKAEHAKAYEGIVAGIRQGKNVSAKTQMRVTKLTDPSHIRLGSNGKIQHRERTTWVTPTYLQVNDLARQAGMESAPIQARGDHETEVRFALIDNKSVPESVLAEYPDLQDEVGKMPLAPAEPVAAAPEVAPAEPWAVSPAELISRDRMIPSRTAPAAMGDVTSEEGARARALQNRQAETEAPDYERHPVGSWGADSDGELMQLREYDIDGLLFPEGLPANETVNKYAKWIESGKQAPPLRAVETISGEISVLEGHHRAAAMKQAGQTKALVWVSVTDPDYKASGLTHKEAVRRAVKAGQDVPAKVLAAYPDLGKPAAAPAETPRATRSEAAKRVTWEKMPTEGGVQTYRAMYTEGDTRITVARVTRPNSQTPWRLDEPAFTGLNGTFGLTEMKKLALEKEILPRLRQEGYVIQESEEEAPPSWDAEWTQLEGQDVLRVPGSNYAAIPVTGKRNAGTFQIIRVSPRGEITQTRLRDHETTELLARYAMGEYDGGKDVPPTAGRGARARVEPEPTVEPAAAPAEPAAIKKTVDEKLTRVQFPALLRKIKGEQGVVKNVDLVRSYYSELAHKISALRDQGDLDQRTIRRVVESGVYDIDGLKKYLPEGVTEEPAAEAPVAPAESAAQAAEPEGIATFRENTELGGVEVQFKTRPPREARDRLKAAGFKWRKEQGLWFAKKSGETERVGREVAGGVAEPAPGPAIETEVVEPEAPQVDTRAQRQVEAIRKAADLTSSRADAVMSADRQTNTPKRAREAAGTMSAARGQKMLADTMRNVADAIERGEAQSLSGVTSKTHFEALESVLHMAQVERGRKADIPWDTIQSQPIGEQDLAFARMPYPTPNPRQLRSLLDDLKGTRGLGGSLSRMRNYVGMRDAPQQMKNADDIASFRDVLKAGKKAGKDSRWLDDEIKNYDRVRKVLNSTRGTSTFTRDVDAELRQALKEYLPLRGVRRQESPIAKAERELVGRKIPGYFPTPTELAGRMVEEAQIEPGMDVLEPSAGKGNIADAIKESAPDANLSTIEPVTDLRTILEAKGHQLVDRDFLEHEGQYDRIVMNPPFEDNQDIEHVQRAYGMLKPGGRVVSIMSEGPFFRQDRKAAAFRDWLEEVGGQSESLPEGSFKSSERPTGVATRLVVIDKAAEAAIEPETTPATGQPDLEAEAIAEAAELSINPDVEARAELAKLKSLNQESRDFFDESLDREPDNAEEILAAARDMNERAYAEKKERIYSEETEELPGMPKRQVRSAPLKKGQPDRGLEGTPLQGAVEEQKQAKAAKGQGDLFAQQMTLNSAIRRGGGIAPSEVERIINASGTLDSPKVVKALEKLGVGTNTVEVLLEENANTDVGNIFRDAGISDFQTFVDAVTDSDQLFVRRDSDPEMAADRAFRNRTLGMPSYPEDTAHGLVPVHAPQPPGAKVSAPKYTPPEIMDGLEAIIMAAGSDVPIRLGHMGRKVKRASGLYKPREHVIRMRTANNMPTAAHETAHALEDALFGFDGGKSPWTSKLIGPKARAELLRLGHALYVDGTPAAEYAREGWAEFVRIYLGTDQATQAAPAFNKWFQAELLAANPDVAREVAKTKERMTAWVQASGQSQVEGMIYEPRSLKERKRRAIKEVRSAPDVFMTQIVESGHVFSQMADAANAALEKTPDGKKLTPSKNPAFIDTAVRMHAGGIVRYMSERGMIDISRKPAGPPLREAARIVGRKNRKPFRRYLMAKRGIAMLDDPRGPRDPGISRAALEQTVEELETPAFQLAAQKFYDWQDGVLNYAASASPQFAQIVERIREVDPGYYIPAQREYETETPWFSSPTSSQPFKKQKGSGRRWKDVFESVLSNSHELISNAHKRMIIDAAINLSKVDGMGRFIEEIPVDEVPAARQSVAEVISTLQKQFGLEVKASEDALSVFGKEGEIPKKVLDAQLVFFQPAFQTPRGESITSHVDEGGKVHWYVVRPELLKALEGQDIQRLGKFWEWTFAKPAAVARMGHTGMRASFTLVTNMQRDFFTYMTQSRAKGLPHRLMANWLLGMKDAALGTFGVRTPYWDLFQRLGGQMSQPLAQDTNETGRAARQLFAGRTAILYDPRNWVASMRDILQFSEAGPRIAELRMRVKDLGVDPANMTLDESLTLMRDVAQVTTDFRAGGDFSRRYNRITPFHGAGIQGPRAFVRRVKENPLGTILNTVNAITIPTLALYAFNHDEDWWDELDRREKMLYWHVPVDILGHKALLKFPTPYEVGMIFKAIPETIFDAVRQQDPEGLKDWLTMFMDVITPPVIPFTVGIVRDIVSGYDWWWERSIDNQWDRVQNIPSDERKSDYTSKAAILLGDLIGDVRFGPNGIIAISPNMIDHLIRAQFGGAGADITTGLLGRGDSGVGGLLRIEDDEDGTRLVFAGQGGEEMPFELSDIPIFGRMFIPGGQTPIYTKTETELYDIVDKYRARASSKRNPLTDDEKRWKAIAEDAGGAVRALRHYRALFLDPKDRERIDKERIQFARNAMERLQSGWLDPMDDIAQARAVAEANVQDAAGAPVSWAGAGGLRGQIARQNARYDMFMGLADGASGAQAEQFRKQAEQAQVTANKIAKKTFGSLGAMLEEMEAHRGQRVDDKGVWRPVEISPVTGRPVPDELARYHSSVSSRRTALLRDYLKNQGAAGATTR